MEPIAIANEPIDIKGKIAIFELDRDYSDEELAYWWQPETEQGPDGIYRIVRPARREPEEGRRKVLEAENLLTNAGITQLLYNLMAPGPGFLQPFSQIFAVGNVAIPGVTRSDTAVAGDGFATGSRLVPVGTGLVGLYTSLSINFASGDAQGTWTNAGVFGVNATTGQPATTTAGTGQLNSHVLFSYAKGAVAIAVNYQFSIQN